MANLIQSLVLTRISLSGWRARIGTSLVIVVGISCVVAVMSSTLAMRAGMIRMFDATGDASRAIVLSVASPGELGTAILPSNIGTILNAPGIARDSAGKTIAEGEVTLFLATPPGNYWNSISVQGIGGAGVALRPGFRIVAGRMFRPGVHELVIGRSAQRVYRLTIGDSVTIRDGEWPIVGIFSSSEDVLESQLVTDATTLMTSERMAAFGSVLVRLRDPGSFASFKQWLTVNPSLAVTAERQTEYYIRTAGFWLNYLNFFAYFVGAIMSIGALLGSINIFYAAVSVRSVEIATFRAVGYRALPVAAAVVSEAVTLAIIGAMVGLGAAWLLFDGREMKTGPSIFTLFVSPQVIGLGFAWAIVLALLGALPPALRAARLPVSVALRST